MALILKSDKVAINTIASTTILDPKLPLISLDFSKGIYNHKTGNTIETLTLSQAITSTRATTATYKDANNMTQVVAVNEPRIHYMQDMDVKGLLLEPLRINLLSNPEAPATQTISISASGTVRSLVLSVEGTGSATMSGDGIVTTRASAIAGMPQAAANVANATASKSITVTVTGTLTKFQLELISANDTYASTFIPNIERKAGSVALSTTLSSKLASAKTVIIDFVELERLHAEPSATNDLMKIADSRNSGRGLHLRRFIPNKDLSRRNQTFFSVNPNTGAVARIQDIVTTNARNFSSGMTFDEGGLNAMQAYNGFVSTVEGEGFYTNFDQLVLGGANNFGGIVKRVRVYDYKMTSSELAAATSV